MKLKFFVIALCLVVFFPFLATCEDKVVNLQWGADGSKSFDKIEKVINVLVGPTAVVTPTDVVSTNTASLYYLNDSPIYPIKLDVVNHGAATLTWNMYSTTTASGVDVPDASDMILLDNNGAKNVSDLNSSFIFYQTPNISFSCGGTASVTFMIRSTTNY